MNSEEHLASHPPIGPDPGVAIGVQTDVEHCPWCDSLISRPRFLQISGKIADQERKKLGQERLRIEKELKQERELFEARLKEETERRLAAQASERDQAVSKLKALELREAAVRQQAVADAEARVRAEADEKLAAVTGERDQAASKLEELELREAAVRQQAAAEAEARIRAEADEKLAAVSGERDQAATRVKELEELTCKHQEELLQQRSALEEDRDSQLGKLTAQRNREQEQLQEKVHGLTRQLQHKTANELGDIAEIDLYEALRDNFVGDNITRIKKGQSGADIRHKVMHKGADCGVILIDAKNRHGWQNAYVTKLREDQVAARAEHAILATNVFPAGKKELYVDQDTKVVVVSRARAVEILRLMREAMIRTHCLGLSLEQRAQKKDRLYEYIISDDYRQHVEEALRLAQEIAELETDERKAHEKVWERRGRMTARLRNSIRDIDTDVTIITEGKDHTSDEQGAR